MLLLGGCTVPDVELQGFTFTCQWDDDCPADAFCDGGRCVAPDAGELAAAAPDQPSDPTQAVQGSDERAPDSEAEDDPPPAADEADPSSVPDIVDDGGPPEDEQDPGPARGSEGGGCRLGGRCDAGLECEEGICQAPVPPDICERWCAAEADTCQRPNDGCVQSCRNGERPPDSTLICITEEMEDGNCDYNMPRDCPIAGVPAVCNEICAVLWDSCGGSSAKPCFDTCMPRAGQDMTLNCLRERADRRMCTARYIEECAHMGGGGFGGDDGGPADGGADAGAGDGGPPPPIHCADGEIDLDGDPATPCEAIGFVVADTFGFGEIATNAGDFNNDGYADLFTGTRRTLEPNDDPPRGMAMVFDGRNGEVLFEQRGEQHGWSLSAGGFYPRPGAEDGLSPHADVLLGATQPNDVNNGSTGVVSMWRHTSAAPRFEVLGFPSEHWGESVKVGWDENGDGLKDVLVVARPGLGNGVDGDKLHVLYSGVWRAGPQPIHAGFGEGIEPSCLDATADFNGDGINDLVVGMFNRRGEDDGGAPNGEVRIYHGAQGWDPQRERPIIARWRTPAWPKYARTCAVVKDDSGDGLPDVAISGFGAASGHCGGIDTIVVSPQEAAADEGRTYRCYGAPDGRSRSVSEAADYDGDGHPEVYVGAGSFVSVYSHNAPAREIWRWTDPRGRRIDVRPGPHGDIDGDGRPDPIFVAHDQWWGEEEVYMIRTSRLCSDQGPIRPTDEHCDGVDNDCDGEIDNGCEP